MQDFTGVPAIADLAAMRNALKEKGINPNKINPSSRVDLVIDHSVMVDKFGDANSYAENVKKEFERNKERYEFLKWGKEAFDNFYLVPPGAGICHQVNIENIAKVEAEKYFGKSFPKIITVSRLDKRKGHDKILMLIKNLKPKFPKIKYVSVGAGEEENSLVKLSKELSLEKEVIFLKNIDHDLKIA